MSWWGRGTLHLNGWDTVGWVLLIPEDGVVDGTLRQGSWSGGLSTVDWVSCLGNRTAKTLVCGNVNVVVELPSSWLDSVQGDLLSLVGLSSIECASGGLDVVDNNVWVDVLNVVLLESGNTAGVLDVGHLLACIADIDAKGALVGRHLGHVDGRRGSGTLVGGCVELLVVVGGLIVAMLANCGQMNPQEDVVRVVVVDCVCCVVRTRTVMLFKKDSKLFLVVASAFSVRAEPARRSH